MKSLFFVFAFIIVGFVTPAEAQTPVSQEMAGQYFANCQANKDPRFDPKVQETFCACTATQMMQNFTVEDMQTMGQQNQQGRNATNKLITNIYAPCIQYPAKSYHYSTCMQNPKAKMLTNDPARLCGCAAEGVASHLQQNARMMFTKILQKNPNISDPMQALYNDRAFQQLAQNKLMGCISR